MGQVRDIIFQGPTDLHGYDRKLPASAQPSNVPVTFTEAMSVREEVFVKEQGVPLLMEADADDARSCHWVAYTSAPGGHMTRPAGTLRLVPFPHEPHPLPGSSWDVDEFLEPNQLTSESPPWIVDRATHFHDGREPYIKFGRLAVTKEFRGQGIADLLVGTALKWAEENPTFFNPVFSENVAHPCLESPRTSWNGLVCVHAQTYVAKAWEKWGFEIDEKMGTWTEAGIPHVGMFKRIPLPEKQE